tara:strand:+ start:472 stop:621 length:150 start_codon:yes stop_codon:yes gene_type:complete
MVYFISYRNVFCDFLDPLMEKLSQKEMFFIRDHQSQFGISGDDDRDYYF